MIAIRLRHSSNDTLAASLLQYENLCPKEEGTDWQTQNNLKIAAAPLLDLMDISGYACLLSDYHETPRPEGTYIDGMGYLS